MRLKVSRNSAEERLLNLINGGYAIRNKFEQAYRAQSGGAYDLRALAGDFREEIDGWRSGALQPLSEIFPTPLEGNIFNAVRGTSVTVVGMRAEFAGVLTWTEAQLQALDELLSKNLSRYTDLPTGTRLYIGDIDSFQKVRDIDPAEVSHLLQEGGYFDRSEDSIQMAIEQIINEPFHKIDWPGEINDLYTSNIKVQGARIAAAFFLKGSGLKAKTMLLKHCGKNGDQLLRLFDSPAQLFVVQFVGNVDESVIRDVEGKVQLRRSEGKPAWYCIINGQDTARLLFAYGKV